MCVCVCVWIDRQTDSIPSLHPSLTHPRTPAPARTCSLPYSVKTRLKPTLVSARISASYVSSSS